MRRIKLKISIKFRTFWSKDDEVEENRERNKKVTKLYEKCFSLWWSRQYYHQRMFFTYKPLHNNEAERTKARARECVSIHNL